MTKSSSPTEVELEQALRQAVRKVYENGDIEDLTVRRIRKTTEERLALANDFFKDDPQWKERSKLIIKEEVDAQPDAEPSSLPTPQSPVASLVQSGNNISECRTRKRASSPIAEPKKRRKTESSSTNNGLQSPRASSKPKQSESSKSNTELSSNPRRQRIDEQAINGVIADASGDEMSEVVDDGSNSSSKHSGDPAGASSSKDQTKPTMNRDFEGSESEMSEVIDVAPKPKRSRTAGIDVKSKRKPKVAKSTKISDTLPDPDSEEIKRLQGWLVKCGIRKMWFKELAPFDASKAKIKHLKAMLVDAGMTGRFSEAKAEQIREDRELKADLQAVQDGNKMWGESPKDDAGAGRPRRRIAKSLEGLDFLNDDDGEETD